MNLSVGLITHNEEQDLPRTLNAVKDIADEIVIVDSGSTDKTIEIAKSFNADVYVEKWKGFGEQKNSVIEKCKGSWILLIDADEEITPELKKEIQQIISGKNSFDVYKIRFLTICFGKKIKHGGWSNFYRIRLFKNGVGKYDNKQVHENFVTAQPAGLIKADINHYTYRNLKEYFDKFNVYTSKLAVQYKEKGKRKSNFNIYVSSKFKFFNMYILKLGILDGFEGYLLAKISSLYIFIKYSKLREIQKKSKEE